MPDLFEQYLAKQMKTVDWLAFQGPVCSQRSGRYATHMGYANVGPFHLKVYKLNDGEMVFDADEAIAALGDCVPVEEFVHGG